MQFQDTFRLMLRDPSRQASAFRRTLVRVLIVQVVTVLLLWLLQSTYGL